MRLTTAEKVNAGYAMALAAVVVIAIASITSIQLFLGTTREVRRTHSVLTQLQNTLANLASAESAQRGFVLTGDEQYLRPYDRAYATVARQIAQLREETFDDSDQQFLLSRLGGNVALRLRLMSDIVAVRREFGLDSAAALVEGGIGRDVMEAIRASAVLFEARELQRLESLERSAARRARVATAVIAAGGLLTVLIVLGSSMLVRRDFSERRRAEQALRESETLLSQFMENLPIGVVVIDAASEPRFANNAAVDIVGTRVLVDTGDEPLPLMQAVDGTPYPNDRAPLSRALSGEHASIDDAVIQVGDRMVPVEVSAAPVYDASGRIAYAIATFSDITERRRSEAALLAAKESAETASRTKSDFLARMSHELRTPLNSVIGFANILMKNKAGRLKEQELTYLQRIHDNGRHLLLLINDILDLSKIEAGKIVIENESVDLTALVEEVSRLWDDQLAGVVELGLEVPDRVDPITSDPARLRQVLINLVGNAVKFTERGTVRVSVDVAPNSSRATHIRVTDTGIGIEPGRLDAIFEAFEQAESSTTRKFGGTGLGLPISRALCELLGYRLTVRSQVGQGTEFIVDLMPSRRPAEPAPRKAGIAAPETGEAAPTGERLVLIVDDEADSRILLTHYVEEFGCRAIATHSGASAMTLARQLRPDLITLDLMMPDVDGWDLLTRLKNDPELARIPVVIVSIIAQESRASLLGAIDLLQKPISRDRLFAVLSRNLGGSTARVLIIDDDDDSRTLLASMLTDRVSDLRTAANGQEALDALRTFEPDLVITDLLMPVMDGMTFLEVFRGTPRFRDVPVVVVTAKDISPDESQRLARHTATVLQKGSSLEMEFRSALASMLRPHGHGGSAHAGSTDTAQRGT
jgi:PAS domain S-box-containing protein